ncbi:MAG: ABC transporter ATP-binding protein [Chloroflexota bacterium]|nr:ABC transporter ATP-binding protein [Chloroflexota bacterium]
MDTPVLEVHDLFVKRDDRVILQAEHLQVHRGEVLAVIGPNGAGKSTLLLVLSRLLTPDRGQIQFNGQSVYELHEVVYRRKIGLVLQNPLLLNSSVFDNVATGLRFRRLPGNEVNRRADTWLNNLGIAHLRRQRASTLSGGEAQRVSLARAFAIQPQVLLLDEPFSALDTPTRTRLMEDFHGLLAATEITTIFITHDLDEALYLGDRVAVLLDGCLCQVGPPQEVFSAPANPDVAAFVGVETVIAGRVVTSQDGQIGIQADGLQLEAVGEVAIGREVFACLRPEDITLLPCGERTESDPSPKSSARNRIAGHIKRMVPHGPLVKVVIECGFPVVALITRSSANEMELEEGSPILASFKASAVHLIPR